MGSDGLFFNGHYVMMVNILYEAMTQQDISIQDIWKIVRDIKLQWINGITTEDDWKSDVCRDDEIITDPYRMLFTIDQNVSIEPIYTDTTSFDAAGLWLKPLYKDNVTDEQLKEGFKILLYLIYCPDENTIELQTFWADLFQNYPERVIIQVLANIIKKNPKYKLITSRDLDNLYEHINKVFNLEMGKIEAALSDKSGLLEVLDHVQLANIKDEVKRCLNLKECQQIEEIIISLGNHSYLKSLAKHSR